MASRLMTGCTSLPQPRIDWMMRGRVLAGRSGAAAGQCRDAGVHGPQLHGIVVQWSRRRVRRVCSVAIPRCTSRRSRPRDGVTKVLESARHLRGMVSAPETSSPRHSTFITHTSLHLAIAPDACPCIRTLLWAARMGRGKARSAGRRQRARIPRDRVRASTPLRQMLHDAPICN
jgi:hypothetical protein